MRKFSAVVFAALALVFVGCGPQPETCSAVNQCATAGKSWQACCTATACRYKLSDGTDVKCAGTNCSSGNPSPAQQTVDWCME